MSSIFHSRVSAAEQTAPSIFKTMLSNCFPVKISDGYQKVKRKIRRRIEKMAAPFESGFLSEREQVIGQLERGTVITKFYGKKVRQTRKAENAFFAEDS